LSNDDQKSTVFSSRQKVVSDGAFLTDDGRLFHAEATGKARSPSVEETEERSIEKTTKSYVSNTFRKVYIRKK